MLSLRKRGRKENAARPSWCCPRFQDSLEIALSICIPSGRRALSTWRSRLCLVALVGWLFLAIASPQPCLGQAQPSSSLPATRSDPYTPHLPARAYAYHCANRVLFFVGLGWRILGIVLFLRA